MSMFSFFLDALFPLYCVGCHQLGTLLCVACQRNALRPRVHIVGEASAWGVQTVTTLGVYGTPELQRLVRLCKYSGVRAAGVLAGELLAETLLCAGIAQGVEVIVPVPLHPRRERERGYNQAAVVGSAVAAQTGVAFLPNALFRTVHTTSQTGLSDSDRAANVADAFVANPAHTSLLRGRRILLVDDVITTGATLAAAANALLQPNTGAQEVHGAGIARGEN